MSTIIIYQSKYGAAKQYAEWLATDLQADLIEAKSVKQKDLNAYDTIIYGGGIYIGQLNGLTSITKYLPPLQHKQFIVFGVGLELQNETLSQTIHETIPNANVFYLRGQLNYKQLSIKDKLLMQGLKAMLKKLKNPTDDQLEILESFHKPVQYTNKTNLTELLHFIHKR